MASTALSSRFSGAALVLPSPSAAHRQSQARTSCPAKNLVIACSHSSAGRPRDHDRWVLTSRRELVAGSFSVVSGLIALPALALLEADDDESLLEKVKVDRQKRIERRGAVSSFKKETESLQKAVYELSKAGQAIDGEDFGLANSVLGTTDVAWIKEVKAAFSKVNRNAEEEGEAANFSAALQALQSAVLEKNAELSKSAFVASANALEKWSSLTGLSDQIKGL